MNPMKRLLLCVFPILALTACSSGGSVVEQLFDTTHADAGDEVGPTVDAQVDVTEDLAEDVFVPNADLHEDLAQDTGFQPCAPGEGCFLDPCTENGDCQSGYCVEHMGAALCTQLCQDECPPGWGCQQVAGTEPDIVFICVSDYANLCKPCVANADCKSVGGADDVCVAYGDEGSFCGGPCETTEDCPWGFSCAETVTVNGVATWQCVAEAGICPCTEKSIEMGLTTACEVTNEFGTCTGQRQCAQEGLTACDAPTPAAETCNGVDDNCDGTVDEPGYVNGEYLPLCDDGLDCTEDLCLGEAGCQHDILSQGECKDGDPCTVGDHCVDGECIGSPVLCDDSNPCTDDSCDGLGGCSFEPNAAACDDGDPCTLGDHCSGGVCVAEAVPCDCQADADCVGLQPDLCAGSLVCDTSEVPYQCVVDPATVVVCPEPTGADAICQAAACDPETGACSLVPDHEGFSCDDANPCTVGESCADGTCAGGVPANCSDDNPCTDDACDPATGCTNVPNSAPCNDGDACTLADTCADGLCVAGGPINCEDNNPCTADSCDPATGCVHAPAEGACDDGNACTVGESCVGGKCGGAQALACDDDNPCTTDSCDPANGCVHGLNSAPCNDGDICTINDHCHLGECIGGGQLPCNDNNPCTADACAPESGCLFEPAAGICDDGNACTDGDACANGLCLPGTAVDCDDDNLCTTDTCVPALGCQHDNNTNPCSDGNACTVDDLCADGLCGSGPPVNCDDANPCTADSCDPAAGCQHDFADGQPCSDGDSCTLGDTCLEGACLPGLDTPDCNDGNPCTDDACVPEFGCIHVNNNAPCDDFNQCTDGDLCADGLCVPGAAVVCPDDGNTCTLESCDELLGCQVDLVPQCCGNGLVEGGEACDDGNQQDGDGCSADCQQNGVVAFGEFRPALRCEDFQYLGISYLQYCFTLKGATYCTGQHDDGNVQCFNEPDGIRFLYDWNATWPMRFTKATQDCQNYHPNYLQYFAYAIGYANYQILQQKTGNSCDRTYLDSNGNWGITNGDSGSLLPYEIRYWN